MAAEIAGCVIPPSRSSTIWMRSRCVDGSFHRSAVLSRRTSALLHLTIRSSRIRWLQRITPQIPKTTPTASPVINTPIHAVLEPVSVGLNEAVHVSGSPFLQLNDNEVAAYVTGSGTNTLTFTYTVQPGDNIPDLQVTGLNLNGGTIKDGAGTALSGSIQGDLALQIDTTPPSTP